MSPSVTLAFTLNIWFFMLAISKRFVPYSDGLARDSEGLPIRLRAAAEQYREAAFEDYEMGVHDLLYKR